MTENAKLMAFSEYYFFLRRNLKKNILIKDVKYKKYKLAIEKKNRLKTNIYDGKSQLILSRQCGKIFNLSSFVYADIIILGCRNNKQLKYRRKKGWIK